MTKVIDIFNCLDELAPCELQESYDNAGFLTGSAGAPVKRVLVALDITDWVIGEAVEKKADVIVSHHPLIRTDYKRVTDQDAVGRKVVRMLNGGIAAICMHTNLDYAEEGMNAQLAKTLGLLDIEQLDQTGTDRYGRAVGCGRIGRLPHAMESGEFFAYLCDMLDSRGLRFYDSGRTISRVGVCGGSGGDFLDNALAKNCDAYVTADLKYASFLTAREEGITLVDADHFCTENVACPMLREVLASRFPELDVIRSEVHGQTTDFYRR